MSLIRKEAVEIVEIQDHDPSPCLAPRISSSNSRKRRRRRNNNVAATAAGGNNMSAPLVVDDFDSSDCIAFAPRTSNAAHVATAKRDDSEVVVVDCIAPKTSAAASAAFASESTSVAVEVLSVRTTPLNRILEVFPDVCTKHAESLLRNVGIQSMQQPVQPAQESMIQNALSTLAESSSYPKSKTDTQFSTTVNVNTNNSNTGMTLQRADALRSFKYDYLSPTCFEPTQSYIYEATKQLRHDFPSLDEHVVKSYMKRYNNHYAIAHQRLCQALTSKTIIRKKTKETPLSELQKQLYDAEQCQALRAAQSTRSLSSIQKRNVGMKSKTSGFLPDRRFVRIGIKDIILKEEVAFVTHKLEIKLADSESKNLYAKARQESEQTGSTMECQCCFGDVALEEMISCREEGHLFCVECVRRFAEEQVFGQGNLGMDKKNNKQPATELLCMYGEGCSSGFHVQHLRKALPEKTLVKYDELQFQAVLEQAGVQDICTCPKCGYQAVLPETQGIFKCPVADCLYESCRKCGGPSHIPLRCDEVVKDKIETKGRLTVEEAISAAKIRSCPKCGKSFIKEHGCNKIFCSCRALVCYICQADITKVGYKHFCQTPHCRHERCGKCPLHSNDKEDDERAMRKAGIKAAEQVRQDNANVEAININVDSLLENPSSNKKPRTNNAAAAIPRRAIRHRRIG